jgi:hypothetical protein
MQTFQTKAAPLRGSPYALLLRQIKQAGLLDRRTGYYLSMIGIAATLLAAGWTAFVVVGQSWWQMAIAVFLAVVFAQVGFLAHDAGHRQIFATRGRNNLAGILLANLAVGLGYGFWVDKHNRHHAHPNQDGKDPDINLRALAFTTGHARGRGRLARFAYRYQAYFFFPLLSLTAFGLHMDSVVYLAGRAGGIGAGNGCCSPSMSPATSAWCSGCSRRSRPRYSSWCTKASSAFTWAPPSPPTTKACRSSTPTTRVTSYDGRY